MMTQLITSHWKVNVASVTFANMADCYDVDVEHSDEACPSTSNLPFGVGPYSKPHTTSTPVAMFYPQLSGYEIHPLIMNQRRRPSHDKLQPETALGNTESDTTLGFSVPSPLQKDAVRQKDMQQLAKQGDGTAMPMISGNNFRENVSLAETETSDYATKSRKSFFCRACGKAFKFQTSLLRHNNKVHISKYQCPTCSRVFSRQAYLDVHTSKQGSSCYLPSSYSNHSPKPDNNSALSNIK